MAIAGAAVVLGPGGDDLVAKGDDPLEHFLISEGGSRYQVLIRGPSVSSSRAEALAALTALCIPAPIRLVTDSQSVALGLARVLSACSRRIACEVLQTGSGPRMLLHPLYNFAVDGDVWQMAHIVSQDRRPGSLEVHKIKSHQSESVVDRGEEARADWEGNRSADEVAARASTSGFERLLLCLGAYRVRLQRHLFVVQQ
eukprot:15475805-Alexandrium_andersonii.AAC.1